MQDSDSKIWLLVAVNQRRQGQSSPSRKCRVEGGFVIVSGAVRVVPVPRPNGCSSIRMLRCSTVASATLMGTDL
jgi:hypothetical protein